MKIRFFYDGVKFRLRSGKIIKDIIKKIILKEKKIPGDLFFIITGNRRILEINREFLKHNYFTDVISFSEHDGNVINGEIYISIDTVRENANNYKVSLKEEIARVIIHGTLHACGYNDDSVKRKNKMTRLENLWLKELKRAKNGL